MITLRARALVSFLLIGVFVVQSPALAFSRTLCQFECLDFQEIYNGYGKVEMRQKSINLAPLASSRPGETHAAFVVSQQVLDGEYDVRFTMNTREQLRTGSEPNPWEMGWFTFGYKPDGMFKYLILKPNGYGVELGEFLGDWNQNFLYTSHVGDVSFNTGTEHHVLVRVRENHIVLVVDGVRQMVYQKSERDRLTTDGAIGFYTEDANVTVSHISIVRY